jgi:DNA (cytosine-5)-methyltransferase 1
MKFGSLFAGIGGIDLGLERAGMECIWQVENDEYCTRVLEKHWPEVQRFGDVRECTNLPPVDLIAGGFPCQPHSVAGKRRGAEDDRNLWPEFIRVVRETKPRYVIAENVPGIITTYIDTVLSDLEDAGYARVPLNLPAVAFDAPHRRERIFIVANRIGMGRKKRTGEGVQSQVEESERQESQHIRKNVADTTGEGLEGQPISEARELQPAKRSREGGIVADSEGDEGGRLRVGEISPHTGPESDGGEEASWWTTEPNVGRVAHGVPSRVDRLRGLGNAVVPQVAEWIGERIMEFDE